MTSKTNPTSVASPYRNADTGADQATKAGVAEPSFAIVHEYQREPLDRMLKINDVVTLTGLCRSSVYNRLREGNFVRRVKVGPRSIRFPESEVRAWIAERLLERDTKGAQDAHA